MTTPPRQQTAQRLEAGFGSGQIWASPSGPQVKVWQTSVCHLLWRDGEDSDAHLRRLWKERKGHRADLVILLAPAGDNGSRLKVLGPQQARTIRELPTERTVELLQQSCSMAAREAAAFLAGEFQRLEEAVLPGLRVKDLLTPHFLRERLCQPIHREKLLSAIKDVPPTSSSGWRNFCQSLGYRIQTLQRGYLLRYQDRPVAVLSPHKAPASFSRLNSSGQLPEGIVLADCEKQGALWGILAAGDRFRLFQRQPPVGSATGQYLEIDAGELEPEHRFYLGLLTPGALQEGGWLTGWVQEAKDFGEELRKGLEDRIIREALPEIARGLGAWLENGGADLGDREELGRIEAAALTLVFRFMFLLHTEARGYLPVHSAAYRPRSARQLAEDCRVAEIKLSPRATHRWDRLRTLVRMVRTGDPSVGVPAYNGSLFAADGFPGSALLEEAEMTDVHLAPALAAIAHRSDERDGPGLDYAGLQIGHLGAMYEKLLSLRLTRAPEDLTYDGKRDVFRPTRAGERAAVRRAELYYQSEAGGRKAGGVFYTRHGFVNHLLDHSLVPALENHLGEVKELAKQRPDEAVCQLFAFSVVDPAMGSAHFLTAALDRIADRLEIFLAETDGLPGIGQFLSELTQEMGPVGQQPEDGDLLRRLILKRCIYGVDLSPMAVEVANITLWLASFVPGLALSYLGSNLKCGNALIGVADLAAVESEQVLYGPPVQKAMAEAAALQREQAAIADRTPEEVKRSEGLGVQQEKVTHNVRNAFDMWTAEPLGVSDARLQLGVYAAAIFSGNTSKFGDAAPLLERAKGIAQRHRFFHWPLEFPGIFHRERPGFDVVVGNPPWNEITVEEPGFYALRAPGLRGLPIAEQRQRIAELDEQHPAWRGEFEQEREDLAILRGFFNESGGYVMQGVGDKDLYQLFCERYSHLMRQNGFMGVVLPRTAFLAEGAKGFRQWLFRTNLLRRIDLLLNKRQWAFTIHPQWTIALLASQHREPDKASFFQLTGPSASPDAFQRATQQGGGVNVRPDSLGESLVVPLLPSQAHAELLAKMRRGIQFDELTFSKISQNPKNRESAAAASRLIPYAELHETQQRRLFNHPPGEGRIPVWKGSSFEQYNPHKKELAGYADFTEIEEFVQKKRRRSRVFKRLLSKEDLNNPKTHPIHRYRIAFRDVTNRTNSRTVIACLIPPRTPLTNTAPYLIAAGWNCWAQASVLGLLNSVPFEWIARRYLETHLSFFILNSLPPPLPSRVPWKRIGKLAAHLSCIDERYAQFAADMRAEGIEMKCGPLTDLERSDMRAEIDALVARAYDLTADELRFIFTDFTENAVNSAQRERTLARFEELG